MPGAQAQGGFHCCTCEAGCWKHCPMQRLETRRTWCWKAAAMGHVMQAMASNADSSSGAARLCKFRRMLVSYSTLARCSPGRRMQDRYFTLAITQGPSPPACDAAAAVRVHVPSASSDDGPRERRRINLRARGSRCARLVRGRRRDARPWSQRRVSTSSAGRPRSASRRSDISCTAAWG